MLKKNLFREKESLLLPLLIGILSTVYLVTIPNTVMLEDDGAFILAGYFNGIAHPPGYPLYTLLLHAIMQLDIGTVAFQGHLMSTIFGITSCVFVYFLTSRITNNRFVAFTAGLTLGFSQLMWSQSLIAEVYTLNASIVLIVYFLALTLYFHHHNNSEHRFFIPSAMLLALTLGLGLSNHWPLLTLTSPGLLLLLWPVRNSLLQRLPLLTCCFLLGLTPYLWMFYKGGQPESFIAFGDIENWKDMVFYISRQGYSDVDQSSYSGWWDKVQFLIFSGQQLLEQFTLAGAAIILLGIFKGIRQYTIIASALLLAVLGNSIVLVALLGFDFDVFHQIIFRVYLLPAYCFLCIFLGIGLLALLQLMNNYAARPIVLSLLLLLPVTLFLKQFPLQDRSHEKHLQSLFLEHYHALPENSILLVKGDYYTGPLGYLSYIEKIRPDIALYHAHGMLYPNRLFHPYKNQRIEKKKILADFIRSQNRPVFATEKLDLGIKQINHGMIWQLNRFDQSFDFSSLNDKTINQFLSINPTSPWQKLYQSSTRLRLISYMIKSNQWRDLSERQRLNLLASFDSGLYYLEILLEKEESPRPIIMDVINILENSKDQHYSKIRLAKFYYLKGLFFAEQEKMAIAVSSWEKSVSLYPDVKNQSISPLAIFYYQKNMMQELKGLSSLTNIEFQNID